MSEGIENSNTEPLSSIRVLLDRAIDYAGLFPPAGLGMESAVRKYDAHRRGPHRWMLGRFVVPVTRLEEFNFAALDLLTSGRSDEVWRLTALAGSDLRADLDRILRFNGWHAERHAERREGTAAEIDVIEIKASSPQMIDAAVRIVPDSLSAYFELQLENDPVEAVRAVARYGAGAKVRTGGVTPEMFPGAKELVRFILECHREGVAVKATAGLHHPLCGVHKLTYQPGSPTGRMYGFLNLLVAAACAVEAVDEDAIMDVIQEDSSSAFSFDDLGVRWNGHFFSMDTLEAVRRRLITAFGSCSFDEPISDLKGMQLL